MSDEIIKVLDDLGDRFGIAIDWTSENVLPYLQNLMDRFITYNIAMNILCITVCAIIIVGSIIGIPKISRYAKEKIKEDPRSDWDCGVVIINVFWVIASILSTTYLLRSISNIIRCVTIPEVVIFNYLQQFM